MSLRRVGRLRSSHSLRPSRGAQASVGGRVTWWPNQLADGDFRQYASACDLLADLVDAARAKPAKLTFALLVLHPRSMGGRQ